MVLSTGAELDRCLLILDGKTEHLQLSSRPRRMSRIAPDDILLSSDDEEEWSNLFHNLEASGTRPAKAISADGEWATLSTEDEGEERGDCDHRPAPALVDLTDETVSPDNHELVTRRSSSPIFFGQSHDAQQSQLRRAALRDTNENAKAVACSRPVPAQLSTKATQLDDEQPTPLTFWIRGEAGKYWSYEAYCNIRNNDKVKVSYCCDLKSSEKVANALLGEKVLGFDMEWKSNGAVGPKARVSLIQVACEDRIALFHIARHKGSAPAELIAPSLRTLIQSPAIAKTGVAILNADGRRLRNDLGLDPQGLFELSHLHRVVEYANRKPELVSKKLVKLTYLAQRHLGRPLDKGPVRTSDWSKPLTPTQVRYAASDAYVGFRLYHAMEAKRMKMLPRPPRPSFAELHLPLMMT
ncbi:MAG: hypothetical protein M1828_002144 [Chrysothrix sp. TS-e1954]|nr:MAG: hypothetical protein M1828_002144 [Chrysothrix sp. TS-e1954]